MSVYAEEYLFRVVQEERRAHELHGEPADIYEMLAILGEEYGELQKAILDFDYDGGSDADPLRECIQVGAMVLKTYTFLRQRRGSKRRGDTHD